MTGTHPPLRTFADRLNHLFATVRPPGEDREYRNKEVANATGVSNSYIGYLRKGARGNPSVDAVQSLARFFGVRPSYLVDDETVIEQPTDVDAQLRLARALANPGISALAMRAADAGLSPRALDAVAQMIEQVRRLDQTSPPTQPDAQHGPATAREIHGAPDGGG